MDAEIEKIKKEYEERQREKKAKKKSKDDKEKKKAEDEDDGKAEQERDDKVDPRDLPHCQPTDHFQIKAIQTGTKPNVEADDEPRIFALQRSLPLGTIPRSFALTLLQELFSDASRSDQKRRLSEEESAPHEGSNLLPHSPSRRHCINEHHGTRLTYFLELGVYVWNYPNKKP